MIGYNLDSLREDTILKNNSLAALPIFPLGGIGIVKALP